MSYTFPADVRQTVELHLATGRYANEDELLRDAFRALHEEDEDLAAVQEAIREWRDGDEGVALTDAFEDVRRAHRIQDTT